ncbi:MFS transporter [Rothia terrae]|uniref:MFS transporter n=1 Tax=Rothia terrae TaxID=396015 RepID=UPI0028822E2D|nr:MFS transporter [Rothia terrae]MDT0189559.1 MFS transporter [Rothia terrae]
MSTASMPLIDHQQATSSNKKKRWVALAILMLPVLLVSIDNTVLSFAVPSIARALEPTGVQQLWIIDAYSLVLAGLLVPMGSLADRIGRKRLLIIGSTGFAAISALAAFAPTAEWLIIARAGLGFFGAMLMPSTLSLIRNIFTDSNERRMALAIWAAGFGSGAALGPVIGGFLLEHFAWGAVFMMAVPVLIPFLILAPLLVPESKDPQPGPIDPLSIGLVMVAMTAITYTIKHIAKVGFDTTLVAAVLIGLVAGWLFTRRQLRQANPMLDMRLFTNKVFTGAISANLLAMMSMVGFIYFVSQHLQLVAGLNPLDAGLFLVPGTLVAMVSGLLFVRLVPRFHPAKVIAFGMFLNAAAFGLIFALGGESNLVLMLAFIVMGLGVGASETLANDVMLSSVPPQKAGAASAISETSYELGAVLGTAILGGILTAVYSKSIDLPAGLSEQQQNTASETLGGATQVASDAGGTLGAQLLEAAQHAFDAGVVWTAGISVLLLVFAGFMVLRMIAGVDPNAEPAEH